MSASRTIGHTVRASALNTVIVLSALITLSCASSSKKAMDLCGEAYYVYWGADWDKVVELTTKAIGIDPELPWAYSLRGVAYTWKGQYDLAISDLTTAILLEPDFVPAYTNRAIACMKMGDFDRSEKDLTRVLEMAPGDVITLVAMAEVQSARHDVQEACRYFSMAVQNGFRDIEAIEKNRNFDTLLYSSCFEEVVNDASIRW